MLVWLASYPRSGNTFVRIVLNDIFGLRTRSTGAGDAPVFSPHPGVIEAVGHVDDFSASPDWIAHARASDDIHIVKTHEPALTDDPAIYIVRDGRSAIVSYYHYIRDVESQPVSMNAVIDGDVYAGSWSEHFVTWDPLRRPQTLLLRYEDIANDHAALIGSLEGFLGVARKTSATRSFASLHTIFPSFFRKGDDAANIAEAEPYMPRIIERHGGVLRDLGYLT